MITAASKAVSAHPSQKDCVLFFEKRGMIGFAPTSTKVGDALCQFNDTDVVAILSKVGQGTPQYEILGRGIDFLASSTKSPKPFCCVGSPGQHGYDVPELPATFAVDISGLQKLTRISAYPEYGKNDDPAKGL